MKSYLIFLTFFACIALRAQDIPRKVNTIIVTGVSFQQVATVLADSNYFIDRKDPDVGSIVTLARPVDQSAVQIMKNNSRRLTRVVFYIRVKDSVATITGRYNVPELDYLKEYTAIANTGMKKSFDNIAWEAMNTFALSLGGTVAYLIK